MFTDPEVANRFKNFVCVKLYTDVSPDPKLRPDQALAKAVLQQEYQKSLGLDLAQPTYAIIEPGKEPFEPLDAERLQAKLIDSRAGVVQKGDFLKFLSRDGADTTTKTAWIQDDYERAWKLAVETNKPIFVEFAGVNDANGRVNERNVLRAPKVAAEFDKYVCLKLYIDKVRDPRLRADEALAIAQRHRKYQEGLGLGSTEPTYAIIEPSDLGPYEGDKLRAKLIDSRPGIIQVADFVHFLRREGLQRADAGRIGGDR